MNMSALDRAQSGPLPVKPETDATGEAVRATDLGKRYGTATALEAVSFTLASGEMLVAVGSDRWVSVDAYPGVVFQGSITNIATQAEPTPRHVQTQANRVKSVFGIKLSVPNVDLRLKPGMFADAVFTASPGPCGG